MPRVLGIDLGTTNSAMAVLTAGDPEIVENSDGNRTTPSVVAVNPKTQERLIGGAAKRQAVTYPEDTVFSAKRFIGRRFGDDEVKSDQSQVPFSLQPLENGDVGILFDGEVRPPAEISAMVLRKLREDAEAKLGEKVNEAVITVPAYFNDAQREATKAAGTIAGLDVKRIVNEPTAAALAFGTENEGDRTIAIYDLGGGTFDVTVLSVKDGVYEVLSTNGDTHLGGDDFDLLLVKHLVELFEGTEKIDLRESSEASPMQRLRDAAEQAKKDLSTQTSTEINLPFLAADRSGPKGLIETLDRAKFERLVDDLIERTVGPCEKALEDAGLSADQIDDVLLVGGMTRMPAVQTRAEAIFGREPVRTINPDEVVAMGAALQAGVLQGDVTDILLLDVTPLSLGTSTRGDEYVKLIERNATIPAVESKQFTTAFDNQTAVLIDIFQGDCERASQNVKLGDFTLDGIAPAAGGVPKIEVTFEIDADGILTVSAMDLATNREQHISIKGRSGISQEEIDRLTADADDYAEQDRARRELGEARNEADNLVFRAEQLLDDRGEGLPRDIKREIDETLEAVKSAMNDDDVDPERLRRLSDALDSATRKAGQLAL